MIKKFLKENLFYAFLFLLPYQARYIWHSGSLAGGYWEYGSFSLYATDILLLFLIVWQTVAFKKETAVNIRRYQGLLAILALFEFSCFLTVFTGVDYQTALYGWLKIVEAVFLVILILTMTVSFDKILTTIFLSGVGQALWALAQFQAQKQFASKWLGVAGLDPGTLGVSVIEYTSYVPQLGEEVGHRFLRAYGGLPHPNILGGFLVVAFVFGLTYYLKQKYNLKKLLASIGLLLIFLGLIVTFSRSAFIAFVLSLAVFWTVMLLRPKITFNQKKDKKDRLFSLSKITLICGASLLIFTLIYPNLILTRLVAQERLEVRSNMERISSLQEGLTMIKEHWLFGVGVNSYTKALFLKDLAAVRDNQNTLAIIKPSYAYQPAHNVYLLVVAELGLLGFVSLVLLGFYVGYIILFKYHLWQNDDFVGVTAGLGVLAVIGLFDHYLWSLSFGSLLTALCLGMFAKVGEK